MDELAAELQRANNKVCHTGHLLNQMTIKLSSSECTQQQMSFLNKHLLLLGEAHKLSMQELQHAGPNSTKEVQMLQMSYEKEVETLKLNLLVQGQKLEAAQQRVGELEAHLSKKEHLIAEQKKFLEDVKCQAKAELQASDCRYRAQRRITQLLPTELLQLYSRVEIEAPACCASASSSGGQSRDAELCRFQCHNGRWTSSNGSTLSPGQRRAALPVQPLTPSMAARTSSRLCWWSPRCPDAPLTVGSYPSTKSFLGLRACELFCNKSESQCDEEEPLLSLTSLLQGLKTELCVELLCT
ncbi:hamartin-like [Thalassophryne amazonica]|uniref:hamartin-like n=1 Tax=Thalassophryne amazonica TaxID=390379 RepID=UPI0014719D22|nr:hamartin-like [Thalassophryne amazonica]